MTNQTGRTPIRDAGCRQSQLWSVGEHRWRSYADQNHKKGTAHFEIHPDMAWKLNCVLASMHPMAIPAEFRQKPKKQTKGLRDDGAPAAVRVVRVIAEMLRPRTTP